MEDQEKFKLDATSVCKMLLLYLLIPSLMVIFVGALLLASGYNEYDSTMMASVLCLSAMSIYIIQHYPKRMDVTLPYQKPVKSFTRQIFTRYIMITIGITYLISLCFNLFTLLVQNQIEFHTIDMSMGNQLLINIFNVVYSILLAPLFEELIFRGLILEKLKPYGTRFAILTVSILFALFHGNLPQTVPLFFFSIVLCKMTLRSESIYPAIITHIIFNTIGTVTSFISNIYIAALIGWVMIIFMGYALIKVIKYLRKHPFKNREKEAWRVRDFFPNWAGIIFLILIILNILTSIELL